MKSIKVPALFHELFGKRTTLFEVWLTLLFSVGMTFVLLTLTYSTWQYLNMWQTILLIILIVDISGGVIANFSFSTNLHYKTNAAARLVFISLHIQPLIIAWLFGDSYGISFAVWGYTVISSLIVNSLIKHPFQRIIAATLVISGVSMFLLLSEDVLNIVLVILILYMFKVIFGFAVDHYAERE